MSTDNDGLSPAGDGLGDLFKDDGLSEDGSTEDVSDLPIRVSTTILSPQPLSTHRSVGTSPHFLQVELFDPGLVGGDGRALDADRVFLDRLGTLDGDLVVGLWVSTCRRGISGLGSRGEIACRREGRLEGWCGGQRLVN